MSSAAASALTITAGSFFFGFVFVSFFSLIALPYSDIGGETGSSGSIYKLQVGDLHPKTAAPPAPKLVQFAKNILF